DNGEARAAPLDLVGLTISRHAGLRMLDRFPSPEQPVDERRLPYIRATDHSDERQAGHRSSVRARTRAKTSSIAWCGVFSLVSSKTASDAGTSGDTGRLESNS